MESVVFPCSLTVQARSVRSMESLMLRREWLVRRSSLSIPRVRINSNLHVIVMYYKHMCNVGLFKLCLISFCSESVLNEDDILIQNLYTKFTKIK
jgi:hypothetical protein